MFPALWISQLLEMAERESLCFRLPSSLANRFRLAAANRGMRQTELMSKLISNLNPDYTPDKPRAPGSISDRFPTRQVGPPKKYSLSEQAQIITESRGGLTIDQVAALWGCNRSTIHRIIRRESTYRAPLKVADPVISVADCQKLRDWKERHPDISYQSLGEEFGVSNVTAWRIVKKTGIYEWYGQNKAALRASKNIDKGSVKISGYG